MDNQEITESVNFEMIFNQDANNLQLGQLPLIFAQGDGDTIAAFQGSFLDAGANQHFDDVFRTFAAKGGFLNQLCVGGGSGSGGIKEHLHGITSFCVFCVPSGTVYSIAQYGDFVKVHFKMLNILKMNI